MKKSFDFKNNRTLIRNLKKIHEIIWEKERNLTKIIKSKK